MRNIKKIVGLNLLLLLVYTLLIHFANSGSEKALGILIASAYIIGLHVFISLVIALVSFGSDKDRGKVWLLNTGIVLLVGFSTCLGSASV